MTANPLTLTQEERELQTKGHLRSATALSIKRAVYAVLCCTVLMLLAVPARADVCSTAFPGSQLRRNHHHNRSRRETLRLRSLEREVRMTASKTSWLESQTIRVWPWVPSS